ARGPAAAGRRRRRPAGRVRPAGPAPGPPPDDRPAAGRLRGQQRRQPPHRPGLGGGGRLCRPRRPPARYCRPRALRTPPRPYRPARRPARVFGSLYGGIGVAAAFAYLVGGLLLDRTGPRVAFVAAGAAGLLATGATALALRRGAK